MKSDVPREDLALQDLARLLSACYYEPGPEFVEERVFDSMATAGALVAPELEAGARRLGAAFESAPLQALLIDYTRLFLGPVDVLAQAYEVSWSAAQVDGPRSTRALEALYAEGGFGVDDAFRERSDHIAVELEFLYLVRFSENRARAAGDAQAAAHSRRLRAELMSQHLGRWTPAFTEAMGSRAETDYYRELANLTAHLMRRELEVAA